MTLRPGQRRGPVRCRSCGAVVSRPHTSHRNLSLGSPCLTCGSYCVPVFNDFTRRCATCGYVRDVPAPPGEAEPLREAVARFRAEKGVRP